MPIRPHDVLFDEHAADQAAIKSLLGEINRITKENKMSKVIKSTDGKFYVVHEYEEITADVAQDLLSRLKDDVAVLEDVLASAPAPAAAPIADPGVPAPQPAPQVNPADAGGVPTTPPPAVDPNQPIPSVPQQPPVNPVAPTDPNAPAPGVAAPQIQ